MCKSPLRIKNPKLAANTFLQCVDKEYLLVPCGHCPECNAKRSKALQFRMYQEYISCLADGGFCLWQTLTYSERTIHKVNGFPLFSKRDIQLFLKRLRKKLHDNGYNSDGNLKYVVVGEYGEKKGRPHYHAAFFVHFKIGPNILDNYIADCWTTLDNLYDKRVSTGFVDNSETSKRIVNDIAALSYISKYIIKGTHLVKTIQMFKSSHWYCYVNDYLRSKSRSWDSLQDYELSKIWKDYIFSHAYYDEIEPLSFIPPLMQSKGLGLSYLEEIDMRNIFDLIPVTTNSCEVPQLYSLPSYYIRKIFYNYDKNTCRYILNDLGKEYKKQIDKSLLDDMSKNVTIDYPLINQLSLQIYQKEFFKIMSIYIKNPGDYERFKYYVCYLKDKTISPMYQYLIMEDESFITSDLHTFKRFCEEMRDDELEQIVSDRVNWSYRVNTDLFGEEIFVESNKVGRYPIWNSLKAFKGFDVFYNILQNIKTKLNEYKNEKLYKDYIKQVNEKIAMRAINEYHCISY